MKVIMSLWKLLAPNQVSARAKSSERSRKNIDQMTHRVLPSTAFTCAP